MKKTKNETYTYTHVTIIDQLLDLLSVFNVIYSTIGYTCIFTVSFDWLNKPKFPKKNNDHRMIEYNLSIKRHRSYVRQAKTCIQHSLAHLLHKNYVL